MKEEFDKCKLIRYAYYQSTKEDREGALTRADSAGLQNCLLKNLLYCVENKPLRLDCSKFFDSQESKTKKESTELHLGNLIAK